MSEVQIGPCGITQDEKNRILRPGKAKFLNSAKRNPQAFMREMGRKELHNYTPTHPIKLQSYYYCPPEADWKVINESNEYGSPYLHWRKRYNTGVPP